MSAPASEGVQDDDDILGVPGDGFVHKTDANPGVHGEQDEEGDDTRIDEAGGASSLGSAKKRRKTAVVSPDGFVADRRTRITCIRGARVFGSHGAGVSALVAGDD